VPKLLKKRMFQVTSQHHRVAKQGSRRVSKVTFYVLGSQSFLRGRIAPLRKGYVRPYSIAVAQSETKTPSFLRSGLQTCCRSISRKTHPVGIVGATNRRHEVCFSSFFQVFSSRPAVFSQVVFTMLARLQKSARDAQPRATDLSGAIKMERCNRVGNCTCGELSLNLELGRLAGTLTGRRECT
jgi:hypothetical protein